MAHAFLFKPAHRLLFLLMTFFTSFGAWANANPTTDSPTSGASFVGTVTANPSVLFFTALEKNAPSTQKTLVTITGVSSSHVTTITAPANYEVSVAGSPFEASLQITGNFTFALDIQLKGNLPIGSFIGNLTITGVELTTQLVALKGSVSSNPSISAKNLFFSTQVGKPSANQPITITVAGVSSTAETLIQLSGSFTFVNPQSDGTEQLFGIIAFNGNKAITLFVRFTGSTTAGDFNGAISITGPEINTKTIPLQATVLAVPTPVVNPTSLSGFTAVEGTSTGAPQSFDLTVNGLPTQGVQAVTVTAPTGYAISFSNNGATFVTSLNLTPSAGKVASKIFVLLKTNNPIGTVKGDLSIKGSQIKTKLLPLTGTVTAKPQPSLTISKTSLSFTTITNKASDVQTYQLTGANLASNVAATVTAPTGYELRLGTSGSSFSTKLTVQSFNGSLNATISVRLKSTNTVSTINGNLTNTLGTLSKTVTLTGKVNAAPSLTLNPTSLTGFAAVKNQASPAKTYQFKAINLAAGVTGTVTAPTGYELRLQNAGAFETTLTLTQSSAGTIDRTVEVRLKAQTTTGTITGSISHSVAGLNKLLSVTGTVSAPTLSTSASNLLLTAVKNQTSPAKTYTLTASNLATGVTATVTASTGYEVRLQNTGSFVTTLTLTQSAAGTISRIVEVRLKATATTGTFNGSLTNSLAGLTKIITLSTTVKALALVTNAASDTTSLTLTTTPLATCQAVVGQPSWAQPWTVKVANGEKNTVFSATTSAKFEFVKENGAVADKVVFKTDKQGNATYTARVRLKGNQAVGPVNGSITMSSKQVAMQTILLDGIVTFKPTPVSNPASLSGFTTVQGSASAAKSFAVSVSDLPDQGTVLVSVIAPTGYSVSVSSNPLTFVSALVLIAENGAITNSTVFVRLNGSSPVGAVNGNITLSGNQVNTKKIPLTGTITPKPQPTLTLNKTSLSFTTVVNKASEVQTYQLTAANLASNAEATVTAPTGYELRLGTSGSLFSTKLTVKSSNGSLNATISVRLKAKSTASTVNGTLTNTVGALSKTITLTGQVKGLPFMLVSPPELTNFFALKNQASPIQVYQLTASNLPDGVAATASAPVGYELRLPNTSNFSTSVSLTQTSAGTIDRLVEVRLKASATTGNFGGTIQNSVAGLTKVVVISGSVVSPTLSVSVASLTGFTQSPLNTKSYNVVASDLISGQSATVTAPANYEVSLSNSTGFANSITLFQTAQGKISRAVFVRLKTTTTGSLSGTITNTVAGLSKTVSVSGTQSISASVDNPSLTASIKFNPASIKDFKAAQGQASSIKEFTVTSSGLPSDGGIAFVSMVAPVGYELRFKELADPKFRDRFGVSGNNSFTMEIRLKANAKPGTYAGNVVISNAKAKLSVQLPLSGIVTAGPKPSVNPSSIAGLKAVQGGLAKASDAKSFAISVSGLSMANGSPLLSITAPAGFVVGFSSNPAVFTNSILVQAKGGKLINELVFVRLAGNQAGPFEGDVVISGDQITSQKVHVSGVVSPATSLIRSASIHEEKVLVEVPADLHVVAFPNPTADVLNVSLEAPVEELVRIELTDLQGKPVMQQELLSVGGKQQVKLSLSEQRSGVYLLQVYTPLKRQVIRVVKF